MAAFLFGVYTLISILSHIDSRWIAASILPLFMMAMVYAGLELFFGRIQVDEKGIQSFGLLYSRSLAWTEIAFYSKGKGDASGTLRLHPIRSEKKRISLTIIMNGYSEILSYVEANFPSYEQHKSLQ